MFGVHQRVLPRASFRCQSNAPLHSFHHVISSLAGSIKEHLKGESKRIDDIGKTLLGSHLVEACSLVISGWGRDRRPPEGLLQAIQKVAGTKPVAAIQPIACFEFEQVLAERERASFALHEAKARASTGASNDRKLASANERLALADAKLESSRSEPEQLLDYAFVTLPHATAKQQVLAAAKRGTLLPDNPSLLVWHAPNPVRAPLGPAGGRPSQCILAGAA